MNQLEVAGISLIAGFILVILASAVSPPRLYQEPGSQTRLEIIESHPGRWLASNALFGLGGLATATGLVLFTIVARGDVSPTLNWVAAAHGRPAQDAVRFPLTFQGQAIGHLIVASRTAGVAFSRSEMRLLRNIARQAGASIRAAQLTDDLRRSRQQIVTAREEERRRLRRDLHHGIGPAMAGQALKLDAALDLLAEASRNGLEPAIPILLVKEGISEPLGPLSGSTHRIED